MPNKLPSSEAVATTPEPAAPPRKIYEVVKYGDPVLEKPGKPVTNFDAELEELVEDMFATMYAAQGVGLAAPQIGKSIRLTVVDVTGGKNPEAKIVLINPEITPVGQPVAGPEGCLSFPGLFVNVRRAKKVVIEAFDLAGNPVQLEAEGLASRAWQHELDHLEGVVFTDRFSTLARLANSRSTSVWVRMH